MHEWEQRRIVDLPDCTRIYSHNKVIHPLQCRSFFAVHGLLWQIAKKQKLQVDEEKKESKAKNIHQCELLEGICLLQVRVDLDPFTIFRISERHLPILEAVFLYYAL